MSAQLCPGRTKHVGNGSISCVGSRRRLKSKSAVGRAGNGSKLRLLQAEELCAKRCRDLEPILEQAQLILNKQSMASLRHVHRRVVRWVHLKRQISKVLSFKLVTTGDE